MTLQDALAELEIVRKAVFGDLGDEPDIYADYDRCCEFARRMTQAIEIIRELTQC